MPACTPRTGRRENAKDNEPVTESEKVHVSIRVRPLNKRERISKKPICLLLNEATTQLSILEEGKGDLGDPRSLHDDYSEKISQMTFQFDSIFWSLSKTRNGSEMVPATQENVFEQVGIPLVNHAFNGFNSCLFAYGQTGSGKTYTMMGANVGTLATDQGRGIAPRIFQEIFQRKSQIESSETNNSTWSVTVGFVEVYNERVSDLLAKRPKSGEEVFLEVREHPNRGVFLEGQRLVPVKQFEEVIKCIENGNIARHTASTKMNNRSSRSHAIIMVLLQEERMMKTKTQVPIRTAGKSSRMNLVDLAGSERISQSEVEGARFTEATHINLSLTTLGRVIDILADMAVKGNRTRYTMAPFRDAKLTFILKDSLGGNSKTMMVAAVSPSAVNYEETLGTLRYASRAREIVNVAKVNEDPRARRIRQLEEEMAEMRKSLAVADASYVAQLEQKIALIESEAQNRAADLQALEKEREQHQLRERMLTATQAERAKLQAQAALLQDQVNESRRQATEMEELNKRLKQEQAQREKKLLEDVKRAEEAMRMKEKTLQQTKMELERERTEREKAMRFIQHYKEKLENALFHSEKSDAERLALEQANTTLNLKLKELEEEQAQYVNSLVKKLEDYEAKMLLTEGEYALMVEESETRRVLWVAHVIDLLQMLYDFHTVSMETATQKVLPQSEGGLKHVSEVLSNCGVTPSSQVNSEVPSQSQRAESEGLIEACARKMSFEDAPKSIQQRESHTDPMKSGEGMKIDTADLQQALTMVSEVDATYSQHVEQIKFHSSALHDAQSKLEDLIERFFTESVSVETEEKAMAARLLDVESARSTFEAEEYELQELQEHFAKQVQQRKEALQNLERAIKAMLHNKFEVELRFADDKDLDLQEALLQTAEANSQEGPDAHSLNTTRMIDTFNSLNLGSLKLSRDNEKGGMFDLSSIKQSIIDNFPVSARLSALLNKRPN